MRFITCFSLVALLAGCTSMTTNYYTQTVQGWRGGNANTLVKRWGAPDQKITGPNGNTAYVYKTESYQASNIGTSPEVGVNFTPGGKPVIITKSNPNFHTSRGLSITCVTVFVANAKGVITDVQAQGRNCYGGQEFANTKSNQ